MSHLKKMVLLYLLPVHCSGLHRHVWTITSLSARAFDETAIEILTFTLTFKYFIFKFTTISAMLG